MIKNISHNPSTGETTVVRILTSQNEPCGKDTGIKFNLPDSISNESLGIDMGITTGKLYKEETIMPRTTKQGSELKYKTVRASGYIGTDKSNLYIRPREHGDVRNTEPSQQDRIERKLDKIINLLENVK